MDLTQLGKLPPPKDDLQPDPTHVLSSEPLSLELANKKAKSFLHASIDKTWYEIPTNSPAKLYYKPYGKTTDGVEVPVVRSSLEIPFSAEKIFDVFWDVQLQKKWDAATVASITIVSIEDPQWIYLQHKVLSAASARRDVLYTRSFERNNSSIFAYGTSGVLNKIPELPKSIFTRARIVFFGLNISQISENQSSVEFVWCFDFGGWIHEKFVEEEIKKVAQRLLKIRQHLEETQAEQPEQFRSPARVPSVKRNFKKPTTESPENSGPVEPVNPLGQEEVGTLVPRVFNKPETEEPGSPLVRVPSVPRVFHKPETEESGSPLVRVPSVRRNFKRPAFTKADEIKQCFEIIASGKEFVTLEDLTLVLDDEKIKNLLVKLPRTSDGLGFDYLKFLETL